MRKITAVDFITLDGVIQNEENDGDGFKYGGWYFPLADPTAGAVIRERMTKQVDLLLGRKTFDLWETYWPTHANIWPTVMTGTKYVASNTRNSSDWENTVFLSGDLPGKIRELKQTDGPEIHVYGSADMCQTLFKNDLIDALELTMVPITLGTGKRLFQDGTIPASFKVAESLVSPNGLFVATFERNGDVKTAVMAD